MSNVFADTINIGFINKNTRFFSDVINEILSINIESLFPYDYIDYHYYFYLLQFLLLLLLFLLKLVGL